MNNPTTLSDPLGLQGGDPCDRNPNKVICGNDAVHSGPPPGAGLFGLDEFDLAQLGFLPGSGLPSGICPAQFQSCTVFPNGVIIGTGSGGLTAFTFGQSLNGAGSPCSARDVEAGDCSVSGINVLGTLNFSSLGSRLDNAYGAVLGFLGRYFRGRAPGQSFGACVGQNMSLLFTGSLTHPLATSIAAGLTGMAGYTLTNFKAANGIELSWYVGAYAGAIAAKYLVPTLGTGAVVTAGNVAGVVAAVGGGVAIGSLLGSAVDCASVGVGP